MVYLCLPMANQGAYVIKKTTPFEVIPVPAGIFCQRMMHPGAARAARDHTAG